MANMKKFLSLLSAIALLTALSACATAPTDPAERAEFDAVNDPLEPMNRTIFEFNQIVDRFLLKPAAEVYRAVLPDFAQAIVHNVVQNANEPIVFMNSVLQGRTHDAGVSFNRFLVNTVAGVGGIADIASEGDLKSVDADFGQTMHVWGFPEGPYLVLPILGPSNPRDAVGFAVDAIASPWSYVVEDMAGPGTRNRYVISSIAASGLDRRAASLDQLEALEKGSVDFYAQLRSVSRQYRHKQLGMADAHNDIRSMNDDGSYRPVAKKSKSRKAKKAALTVPQVPPTTGLNTAAPSK